MELKIQNSENFQEAMGINIINVTSYLTLFANIMKSAETRTQCIKCIYDKMQKEEETARIILYLAFTKSNELLKEFQDDPKLFL